jgi:hypothetical protein
MKLKLSDDSKKLIESDIITISQRIRSLGCKYPNI